MPSLTSEIWSSLDKGLHRAEAGRRGLALVLVFGALYLATRGKRRARRRRRSRG